MKKLYNKFITSVFSGIIAVVTFFVPAINELDTFGYRYFAVNAITGSISSADVDAVNDVKSKAGGYIKGICHPEGNYQAVNDLNIEWIRDDIGSPALDKNGNETYSYKHFKKECREMIDNGLKVFAVTAYPDDYLEYGIDPRTPEGKELLAKDAEYMIKDLKGLVGGIQITNEMGQKRFREPLTEDEAAEFIGIQLKAMAPFKDDIIVGFNLDNAIIYNFYDKLKDYLPYCDYVGCDLYFGCFEEYAKMTFVFDAVVNAVYETYQKPVMVCEFGYLSYGQPKTDAEKKKILQSYGFNSEKEAREHIRELIPKLNEAMQLQISYYHCTTDEEYAAALFDTELANHFYSELHKGYQLWGYKHTLDGQAKFFRDVLKRFKNNKRICGSFVYHLNDDDSCYVCSQSTCPIEMGWGLIDGTGKPKPSYYAVQKAFAEWDK